MKIYDETCEFEKDLFYIDTLAYEKERSIGVMIYRNNKENLIFDSSMPDSTRAILDSMKKLEIDPYSTRHILLTHRHLDHAGGSSALIKKIPHALVGIHPFSVKHLADPSKIYEGFKHLFDNYAIPMEPIPKSSIHAVSDNEEIQVGQDKVQAVYSLGHTSDHISYYIPSRRTLYCGELIGAFSPKRRRVYPTCLYPSFNYQEYKKSMERISELDVRILVFPHFGVVIGDTKKILNESLAMYQTLEETVKRHDSKDREDQVNELGKIFKEATDTYPMSVRDKAAEFMARGFIESIS